MIPEEFSANRRCGEGCGVIAGMAATDAVVDARAVLGCARAWDFVPSVL